MAFTSYKLPLIDYLRDACPGCGNDMVYPTSCRCTYEKRVFALAGLNPSDADLADRDTLCRINAAMRALDQSDTYPIRNRFSGTERAIRYARRLMAANGTMGAWEYAAVVDGEIGRIVNSL